MVKFTGFSLKLSEIYLDGLLGKLVSIHYKLPKKEHPAVSLGFFGGYDDKKLYISRSELDKPVTKMGFLERLLTFNINSIPIEEITEIWVYTWATRYYVKK